MYISIVHLDTPACDHDTAVEISLNATDKYTALENKGLLLKYFLSNENGGGGGVYIWKNKAAAEAWFTSKWRDQFRDLYGSEPIITNYDSFVHVDNIRNQIVVDGQRYLK